MANDDRPWWGRNDPLWGGETFKFSKTSTRLGVKKVDRFRLEEGPKGVITLIPHPKNKGTWKDSHSNSNPIKLTPFGGTPFDRAFSMMVKITAGSTPKQLFLFERRNGSIAVTDDIEDPGAHGGTASVER